MSEDYGSAAQRHWHDASFLHAHNRIDNADHLVGFAVECAIKFAIDRAGQLNRRQNRPPTLLDDKKTQLRHVNQLWQEAKLFSFLPAPLFAELGRAELPFSDWDANQRYQITGAIAPDCVMAHMDAARRVLTASGIGQP